MIPILSDDDDESHTSVSMTLSPSASCRRLFHWGSLSPPRRSVDHKIPVLLTRHCFQCYGLINSQWESWWKVVSEGENPWRDMQRLLPCCYLNAPHPLRSALDSSRLRATSWYFMISWLAMLDIRICVLSPTWDNYQQPQLEYELANAESSHHLDATYHSKK